MDILVVEDDPVTRVVIGKKLANLGFSTVLVEDGESAWDELQRRHVDVLMTDWVLPGMDGLELSRAVRRRYERHPGTPYTYVIVLTALASRESRLEAIRAGVDDYLVKPLDVHELLLRLIVAERVSALHRRLEGQALEAARLNRELHAAVRRDPLTGVGNRKSLGEAVLMASVDASEGALPVCIALVDVDQFKAFNDLYLHAPGDEALRRVAGLLEAALARIEGAGTRGVFRFGGEEFVLLLGGLAIADAVRFCDHVRAGVEALGIDHRGNPPHGVVTVSVGVAEVVRRPGGTSPAQVEAAILTADRALYDAKRGGRNRTIITPMAEPDR